MPEGGGAWETPGGCCWACRRVSLGRGTPALPEESWERREAAWAPRGRQGFHVLGAGRATSVPAAAVEQAVCTQCVRPEPLGQPACAAGCGQLAGPQASGLGGQDRGPCTRLCGPRRAKGPCDAAPAPHPHCRPRGWAAGRWPTKGILCPGRMTPLCGWRVAGSHDGFLPSQLPAHSPLGGRAPTWGPAAPARALLSRAGRLVAPPPPPAVRARLSARRPHRARGPVLGSAWASAAGRQRGLVGT